MRKTKAPELLRFGDNVRKLREQREWTQEQLAEKSDLNQRVSLRWSGFENLAAVVRQKLRVWLGQHIRSSDGLTFKGGERLFEHRLREMLFQSWAEYDAHLLVQCDQAVVEGGIVQT